VVFVVELVGYNRSLNLHSDWDRSKRCNTYELDTVDGTRLLVSDAKTKVRPQLIS
jgi:hypothetical protein